MKLFKRAALVLLSLIAILPRDAAAQDYPTRTTTILVPFAPGGGTDLIARAIGAKLEQRHGKSFVVENRPGAGTTIAAGATAKAAPDGYTLMQATSTTMAIAVTMHKKLPYEPLKDLVPVALYSSSPFFLVVRADSPIKSVQDLIEAAKAKPNGFNCGSGGPGSMHHLSTELFQSLTGTKMTHVPYKATPPAMNDLIAGHIQVLFGDSTSTLPIINQGKVRALGVTTLKRSPAAPDVPAIAETVPGFESASWQMLVAPGAVPPEVVALLNREVHTIFSDPAVIKELHRRGVGPVVTGPPEEVTAFVKKEIVRWGEVVARAGLAGTQ